MYRSPRVKLTKRALRKWYDKNRKPAATQAVVKPFELKYRPHEYGPGHNRVRVWRTDWSGDCFEILSTQEFDQLTKVCQRFNISLLEADDD
jgi:hypothetical protein